MRADMFNVKHTVDHWFEGIVNRITVRDVQLGIAQVTDAWREAEAKQVHQGKDMIGKACCIGVAFLDP